ncbi:restriction endonuclease subunit S [Providencia rustigianii]|uniref:restriction endonuclease subunit S n=1 Tax=Providencia rustigianii TaxID=158850 RepID=UPI00223F2413|nr:restriction endonuclease subunit S [Providencia rustigianii]
MSFKTYTLGEIASNTSRRFNFNDKEQVCFVNTGDILDGHFLVDEKVSSIGLPGQAKKAIQKGDILYSEIRPGNKRHLLVNTDVDDYVVSTKFMVITCNHDVVIPEYLYLVLTSKECEAEFKVIADSRSGTFPQITFDAVAYYPIELPNLIQQRAVVEFIKSITGKLNLNNQTNQTLEQMAQAIFKSWFVDFDPVKAKMNGEQPEGMDAATASLFPDKLDSETGIPNGWTQGSIADIAKLNAKSWTKKNSPEQVHYVDLANTKNGVIESVTTYDFEESPSRARRILNSGDTIVGTVRPGNRSYAFIGDTEKPLTGSTGFAVLSPKKSYWTSFVYLATTNDDSIDEYARLADGGAYPAIKPAVVADTQCAIPTEDIAKKFWELTGPMLRKAHQNRLQNEDLAALRDTLLPKLLSGDVKLSDPKVKVGEIG